MKTLVSLAFLCLITFSSCGRSTVPPGYVGIKVNLLGSDKGVDHEVLGVGRYYIGMNEQLYTFPTFQQNYVWSSSSAEGSVDDESIEFGALGGVDVHANVGISFHVDKDHIAEIFQKYREGLDEIRNVPLRNAVRDSFQREGASYGVEQLYGPEKAKLMNTVLVDVRREFDPLGISVDTISIVGNFKLPVNVTDSLNAKIEATQKAEQSQNEVAMAIAEANKARELARGVADANTIKAKSLTPALIEWEKVQKWNGTLPQVSGSGTMSMINLAK